MLFFTVTILFFSSFSSASKATKKIQIYYGIYMPPQRREEQN